ncbi:OprD family outer membrane porin [bacterium]|nr:OprD family outer membrane porin [bacterium]MBU1993322.1 OprD family outer membrane porin [bacterium]
MFDGIYLADAQLSSPKAIEQREAIEQMGLIHSKVAGKYEIVQKLPQEANNFDELFDYADFFGKLRLAYINSAHKISALPNKEEKSATAFGGELGIKTAEYHGFGVTAITNVSQNVHFLNPRREDTNEDFFGRNVDSFAYISQASINYNHEQMQTKIGRILVETPYANSDDIRMAANTFEGAWAKIEYMPEFKTQVFYLNKWAGYDSQDELAGAFQNEFKNLVSEESFGMTGISLTYEYAKNSEMSLWYNYIDKMSQITYAEIIGIYFIDGDDFHLDYGAQYSNFQELNNSNVDGNVFGAMSILHYKGFFLAGAYNKALVEDGKYITNGFGGGPYYTSLDEATLSAISEALPGSDAESFKIATGVEFKSSTLEGLMVEFVYGELRNDEGMIEEKDIIMTYPLNQRWNFEATYTDYKSSGNKNTFDRTLVRLDYSF